ncbi:MULTISPECIES: antibiotic biosynthesis monooxygenase [Kitasatospora]|uniref:ABM domain-containing protein n=1 Tax=Kitasatospora arboriphila TaxID=258052 RepID=A0ABN1TKT9_9ACTN
MYVRTLYATGDPARIDEALDALRAEAVGLLTDRPGYRGYGLFADRTVGKIAMGSWWESEQAQQDSDEALKARRAALLAPFAGTVTVDVWEAAAFSPPAPAAPGAGFRMVRADIDPARIDDLVERFRTTLLPEMGRLDGFVSGTLLVNRAEGRSSVGTIFRDRAALEASRAPQAALRARNVPAAGVTVRSLEEFEVVLLDRPADHG